MDTNEVIKQLDNVTVELLTQQITTLAKHVKALMDDSARYKAQIERLENGLQNAFDIFSKEGEHY